MISVNEFYFNTWFDVYLLLSLYGKSTRDIYMASANNIFNYFLKLSKDEKDFYFNMVTHMRAAGISIEAVRIELKVIYTMFYKQYMTFKKNNVKIGTNEQFLMFLEDVENFKTGNGRTKKYGEYLLKDIGVKEETLELYRSL